MERVLKTRREEIGRNLKDIARETRIKESYLKAIEEEEFSKLPVEVYTKGYINIYAKFLGVSSDAALAAYERYLDDKKGIKRSEGDDGLISDACEEALPADMQPSSNNDLLQTASEALSNKDSRYQLLISKIFSQKIVWAAPLVIVMTAIIVGAYLLMPQKRDVPLPPKETESGLQIQGKQQESHKDNLASLTNQPLTRDDKLRENTSQKKKHSLDIVATDKVWLQLVIDGSEKKEMLLNAGEKVNYGANESFNVLIGNAGGVELKFDGKEFKNLGDKGQVITLNFPVL